MAIEVAERFAAELATMAELDAVRKRAYQVRDAGDVAKLAADAAERDSRQACPAAATIR